MKDWQSLFDAGDAEGLVRLGTDLFRSGDETGAFECYRAACKLGNAVAMGNLGFCYQNGRGVKADNRLAAYCYQRASELDDVVSTLKLGDFHYHGKGGLPVDRVKAYGCYLRAYELVCGSEDDLTVAEICYRLGVCKKDGAGVDRNYEDAYEYFQAAAEAAAPDAEEGNPRAEALLNKADAAMAECESHF